MAAAYGVLISRTPAPGARRKSRDGRDGQLVHRPDGSAALGQSALSRRPMGMYGAFALGGPLGLALLHRVGFGGLMVVCTIVPLLGLIAIQRVPRRRAASRQSANRSGGSSAGSGGRAPRWDCRGSALRRWARSSRSISSAAAGPYAGLGLTCFGVGFVAVRVLCGHLPDRIGGTRVAIVSLIVEACGQYLLWLAPNPPLALIGALLTGLGCSMGVSVDGLGGRQAGAATTARPRRSAASPHSRIWPTARPGPLVGLLADSSGYSSVFLIGGLAATLGIWMAISTHRAAATATERRRDSPGS